MVIGITGGYCTGKTQAGRIFRKFGAKIIDLDRLAHRTLKPKTKTFEKIVKEFGRDILVNNRIDRLLLAYEVFNHKKKLAKLNSIIHPIVIRQMDSLVRKFNNKYKIIIVEAPLLFEAGLKNYFDYIAVVKTDKKTQIERAIQKTGLTKKDVLRRINSQMPIKKKLAYADFVIDNSGSIRKTSKQVENIINQLKVRHTSCVVIKRRLRCKRQKR